MRVTKRWRYARRWPRSADLERMSAGAFEDYLRDVGFDARIR
jgi:hypothetical protein